MPTLRLRKGSNYDDVSEFYIASAVEGRHVTYQVLPEAIPLIREHLPGVDLWSLPEDGVKLDLGFVIDLRQMGYLKTKRELWRRRKPSYV